MTAEQEEELGGAPTLDDTDESFVPSYEDEDAEDADESTTTSRPEEEEEN